MAIAHINAIGTANPPNDIHGAYVDLVANRLDRRNARLFRRMAGRAGISHRYSVFTPGEANGESADAEGFFRHGDYPGTRARMDRYEAEAPALALAAIAKLAPDPAKITHLIVCSCTGFTAPGLDQHIATAMGLSADVERTVVGFMGCYAAVNSLRLANHIIRSTPEARVLVVNVELCSLHFQDTSDLEKTLSSMLFADGATAALVTADQTGFALEDFRAAAIAQSAEAITWRIGDSGFDMHLSGEVPRHIETALKAGRDAADGGLLRGEAPERYDAWAVHAGGRTILDAVERGFDLPDDALSPSRAVLDTFGNMSSATLMFVLSSMLAEGRRVTRGMAMAFGPGLAAESFRFRSA
ncbi:type III polyketide synthase [Pacificimonas sp. WHA3]|uniref:Type III polyketide synthase n=1 Tax=Pacificimonas pallii TaxID=2827236 RepID=A0ABS6SCD6_9SPHN|nr:type III polyketide synthase [Pacificimonas pallii]MBV7255571.1 type III polyketide synthase [Pacificimonas pallii]